MKRSRLIIFGLLLGAAVVLMVCPAPQAQRSRDRVPQLVLSPNIPLDSVPWRETAHSINRLQLVVSNRGTLGKHTNDYSTERDYFTGEVIQRGVVFPRGSKHIYLQNVSLEVAKPAKLHPVVEFGYNWWAWGELGFFLPDSPPGTMTRRSITDRFGEPDPYAVSEEDIICHYTDSVELLSWGLNDFTFQRNPRAIGLEIDQESYGWSMEYAEDVIFVTYTIRNYTDTVHRDVYVGLHIHPHAGLFLNCYGFYDGDMFGFRRAAPSVYGCGFVDSIDVAWNASTTGNPVEGLWQDKPEWDPLDKCYFGSVRGITGIMPLQTPISEVPPNFNWWTNVRDSIEDIYFEPSKSGAPSYRRERYVPDTPEERYRLMSTHEIDPPTYRIHDIQSSPFNDWMHIPITYANLVTVQGGWESDLSWGPLVLGPGQVTRLTFAVVGGEKLHNYPNNKFSLPFHVDDFYDSLDFSDFDRNLVMAQWIYDNPGVDTDGDGYFGEYRVCVHDSSLIDGNWVATRADTQWYRGDGIPDYRGSKPPPTPKMWVSQIQNGLHIRFNGQYSETERDIFMQIPDWEGYRIYLGRDERHESLALIGSYDKLDYDKLFYNQTLQDGPEWQMLDRPFTVEELRCLYGSGLEPCTDSSFDPLLFTQFRPYLSPVYPESIFAFVPHDYNTADLGYNTPVTKTYPNMPDPRLLPADSITADMYTEDGYLKFYEYQLDVTNLLPTVQYYVSITAFDFGSPAQGLNPLESSQDDNLTPAFPMHEMDSPLSGSDKVYVYPNPYRIDADYRGLGFEGRAQDDRWDERVRAIWFANLPPKCTINIWTLDGDRVRTIEHDKPISDPTYSRERWDLINRNFQIIVSGLYYWTVEAPDKETQIGKLVVLR